MKPLVSILIPAFNAERWITDTINSALNQSWPQKEIIVVDDGSTDDTFKIARRFAGKNVQVVTGPNQGAAGARNRAFSLSQGDYIQWLDADDLLSTDKVAKQLSLVDEGTSSRTLLSSAWGTFIYRPERAVFTPSPLWADQSPTDWMVRKLRQNLHMQTATWLVTRELTDAAGPWDTRLIGDDDGEYFCRVLRASDGIRFTPDARVFYRRAGVSSLSYLGHSSRKLEAHFLSMELHINYLRSLEDSRRVREACAAYLQTWLVHFYPERPDLVAQAKSLAADVGRQLQDPQLSWKYDWIRQVFGWRAAKQAWLLLPELKFFVVSFCDKAAVSFRRPASRRIEGH